jgi:hypothetical protein
LTTVRCRSALGAAEADPALANVDERDFVEQNGGATEPKAARRKALTVAGCAAEEATERTVRYRAKRRRATAPLGELRV